MTTKNRPWLPNPQNATDEGSTIPTLDDLYKGFGITPPGQDDQNKDDDDDDKTKNQSTDDDPTNQSDSGSKSPPDHSDISDSSDDKSKDPADDSGKEPDDKKKEPEDSADPPKSKPSKAEQQAAAFAQLRVQNKEQQKLINGIAAILGVKDTNPEIVMQKLNDLIVQSQAKSAGVPEEVYRRLQMLEQRDQEYTQQQLRAQAYTGFQKVKDKYNLTTEQLAQFATALAESGNNPFEKPVDILKEYRNMYFEDIIKIERAKAVQEEVERQKKVENHGTNPGKNSGPGGNTEPERISTVAQLNEWGNKQKV